MLYNSPGAVRLCLAGGGRMMSYQAQLVKQVRGLFNITSVLVLRGQNPSAKECCIDRGDSFDSSVHFKTLVFLNL